ncbi:uncharacterized protein BDZ99DRAFT_493939 [Mytilinidion resinicola]|uniref:Uncharacterized protein n=1 Tax=Mytilinidion resinicola TaxID=574789 RepID=A0A6A6Z4G1_9PEZI|nr:uncharacterized protein BDZ99DRAFT_493939 [Mytilinidion resinicola]KAF2816031.1 hypothetical protein BDZ99DRAFT_493939 [Mytilinidion resinicola]
MRPSVANRSSTTNTPGMSLPWWWLTWQYYEDTIIIRNPTGELRWEDGEWHHSDYPPHDLGRHYFPYERPGPAPSAENVQIGGFGSWPEDPRPVQNHLRRIMSELPPLAAECQRISFARWPRTANLSDPKGPIQKEQVDRFRGGMLPPEACDLEAQASLGGRLGKGLTFSVARSPNDFTNVYLLAQSVFSNIFGHPTWFVHGYSHMRPTMPTASDFSDLGRLRRRNAETPPSSLSPISPSAHSVLSGLPGRFINSIGRDAEIRPSRPRNMIPSPLRSAYEQYTSRRLPHATFAPRRTFEARERPGAPDRDDEPSSYEKIPQIPKMSWKSTRMLQLGFRRLRSDDLEPITFEKRTLDINSKLNQRNVLAEGLQQLASTPTNSTVDVRGLRRVRGVFNLRDGRIPAISGESTPSIWSGFSNSGDSVASNYGSSARSSLSSNNDANDQRRLHEHFDENGLDFFVDRWQPRSPLPSPSVPDEEPDLEAGINVDLEAQAIREKKPFHKKVIGAMKKTAKTLFRKT